MILVDYVLTALAWLGRHGPRAIAASVFLGLAAPQLASLIKPIVGPTIFLLLTLSILRVDLAHLRRYFRSPGLIVAATLWLMVVSPLVFGGLLYASGLAQSYPQIFLILILWITATPITSAPAFAALMGLDITLTLGTLFLCTVISPLTMPAFVYLWSGSVLITPLDLGIRSAVFYIAASAVAFVIFRYAGQAAIERNSDKIDGISVIALFVFAVAAMDGVAAHLRDVPLFAFVLLVANFVAAAVLMVFTALPFLGVGRAQALAIGVQGGTRNLSVPLAVIGVANIPEQMWLYFALAQFPVYLTPMLVKPLVRRLLPPGRGEA